MAKPRITKKFEMGVDDTLYNQLVSDSRNQQIGIVTVIRQILLTHYNKKKKKK